MGTTSVIIIMFFSKVPFWNYLITAMFKILLQQLRGTLTTEFETMPYSWRFYGHGSAYELIVSWVYFLKRKIMYIIICACSSKNIAPRHFIYYCMLLLLSNKPSFWIWHCVAPIIFATTYLSFFYFLYSVFLEVNPEPPCFL